MKFKHFVGEDPWCLIDLDKGTLKANGMYTEELHYRGVGFEMINNREAKVFLNKKKTRYCTVTFKSETVLRNWLNTLGRKP